MYHDVSFDITKLICSFLFFLHGADKTAGYPMKDELEHEVVEPLSEYPPEKYPSQKFILIIETDA